MSTANIKSALKTAADWLIYFKPAQTGNKPNGIKNRDHAKCAS